MAKQENFVVERRRRIRRAVKARVVASANGGQPGPCELVDMTADGARVATAPGSATPANFDLRIDDLRRLGEAEVVWRKGDEVGVRFLDKP